VIKNVAGYDLAKLFTGSFGTLGLILSVSVRLHPLPDTRATALGAAADPDRLAGAVVALARAPLELEALDIAWRGGRGGLLAQVGGAEAARRARRAAALMREAGLEHVDVTSDDAALWARQRAGQRSAHRAIVRVAARRTDLPAVLRAVDACQATLVGRCAFGESYVEVSPRHLTELRERLPAGAIAIVLDRPDGADPWPEADAASLELMRAVKRRFDPSCVCNPGVFVGAI
jgi:glycolate oxidase FAD binding subunit